MHTFDFIRVPDLRRVPNSATMHIKSGGSEVFRPVR
jgi:hypothetical protein